MSPGEHELATMNTAQDDAVMARASGTQTVAAADGRTLIGTLADDGRPHHPETGRQAGFESLLLASVSVRSPWGSTVTIEPPRENAIVFPSGAQAG